MYFRLGHSSKHHVKKGDLVKKGQLVAEVGTGNGQWSAHAHADFPIIPVWWTDYVFEKTKDEVQKAYADPAPYRKICFPDYDHMGWGYLELATYGTKKCYHPGEDWNGKGAGNADYGYPIYSPFDGKVVLDMDDGKAKNGGWGRLLVIQEEIQAPRTEEIAETPQSTTEAEKPQETQNLNAQSEPVEFIQVPVKTLEQIAEEAPQANPITSNNMQKQFSFDSVTLKKIGKGVLIAGGGATLTYLAQYVASADFGVYTAVIVAVSSILINVVKEYIEGYSEEE